MKASCANRLPVRLSIIISVLESYEIVRRQCRHLASIMPEDCELILLDDGSDPPLPMPEQRPKRFSLVYTRNLTPWTQPIARNFGARLSRGEYVFFHRHRPHCQRRGSAGRM